MKKKKERPGGLAGLAILNLFRKPATQTAQFGVEGNSKGLPRAAAVRSHDLHQLRNVYAGLPDGRDHD